MRRTVFGLLLAAAAIAVPAAAQQGTRESVVSIYRSAPGHQEALLRWFARQDEISRAAGLPPSQLYVHQDGASWDFIVISPQTTREQDTAADAAARRMRAPVGPRAGLELRQHIAEHSDTIAVGPTTAADWLRRIGE